MEELNEFLHKSAKKSDNEYNGIFGPERTSLLIFLKHYYATFENVSHSFGYFNIIRPEGYKKLHLSDVDSTQYNYNYYISIVFAAHLLENLIKKAALSVSSEVLTRKPDLNKLYENYVGELSKSIGVMEVYDRVINLFLRDSKYRSRRKINSKYKFLIIHETTIRALFHLRNDIIHSGIKKLHLYKYDFFVVNNLFPLLRDYNKKFLVVNDVDRSSFAQRGIFRKILQIDLPKDINSDVRYTLKSTKKLTHLKSLGYSSLEKLVYHIDDIPKGPQRKENLALINKEIKYKYELMTFEYAKIYPNSRLIKCLCCGLNTLFLEPWHTHSNTTSYKNGRCIACGYSIDSSWGEPKDFGIYNQIIFS